MFSWIVVYVQHIFLEVKQHINQNSVAFLADRLPSFNGRRLFRLDNVHRSLLSPLSRHLSCRVMSCQVCLRVPDVNLWHLWPASKCGATPSCGVSRTVYPGGCSHSAAGSFEPSWSVMSSA